MQAAAKASSVQQNDRVIEISKVSTRFGDHVVHCELDLEVRRAEIFAIIGGSGSGKSTLLREMILLQRPDAGAIRVLGADLRNLGDGEAIALRQRWGVMFQHGGLFGSLTVRENVGLPLREHTALEDGLIDAIAASKLAMTGLERGRRAVSVRTQRRMMKGVARARWRSTRTAVRPPASTGQRRRGRPTGGELRDLFA
jgi:phospholipid/cholesterol/gamma-HCH transport system ATP-binding protein